MTLEEEMALEEEAVWAEAMTLEETAWEEAIAMEEASTATVITTEEEEEEETTEETIDLITTKVDSIITSQSLNAMKREALVVTDTTAITTTEEANHINLRCPTTKSSSVLLTRTSMREITQCIIMSIDVEEAEVEVTSVMTAATTKVIDTKEMEETSTETIMARVKAS